jgi:hypothetical protein
MTNAHPLRLRAPPGPESYTRAPDETTPVKGAEGGCPAR